MKYISCILFLLLVPVFIYAQGKQETNLGASLAVELQKDLNKKIRVSLEEEVRLLNNRVGFGRSVTSLGLDYSFLNDKAKVGTYYSFIYLYNNDFLYEARHRYYANLSYKESFGQFSISWRGRFQSTHRNENRGDYKINPKYIMKNKAEVEYSIWGKPWKPFVSCELYSELNNPMGNELYRIRYQGGTTWRLNRTEYLEFFLRYDNNLNRLDDNALMLGIAFRKRL